jgi:type I restriction enzyme S subunit
MTKNENERNVPELRFRGFTDAWEKRKLESLTSERTTRSAEGELLSVTMHEGVVRFSDLDRKDNSSENKSNYKVVHKGDVAYNSMRMWQGASGLSEYQGIVSPAYTVVVPTHDVYGEFLGVLFKRTNLIWTFRTHSQGLTSDTWNLKYPALSKISVVIPNLAEQKAIVEFFQGINDTIALHQRKLDELKKLKQAYLQKMFV